MMAVLWEKHKRMENAGARVHRRRIAHLMAGVDRIDGVWRAGWPNPADLNFDFFHAPQ
jgi:hypothetical protein